MDEFSVDDNSEAHPLKQEDHYINGSIKLEKNSVITNDGYPSLDNGNIVSKTADMSRHSLSSSVHTASVHSVAVCDITSDGVTEIDDITKGVTQNDDVTNLAPDGGWGWVILVAVFLSEVTVGIFIVSFSLTYTPLVDYFQAERGTIGWIGSLAIFSGNILGILIGALIQRFGERSVGILGTLIWSAGVGLSSFTVNIPYMYFAYGIIAGIGYAMVAMADLVILQLYFNKKRTMALGIGTAGFSLGAIVASPLVNFLLDQYGLSGMYIISAGICLHNIALTALFRPLQIKSKSKGNGENVGTDEDEDHSRKVPKPSSFSSDMCDCTPLRNVKFVLYLIGIFLMHMGFVGFYNHFLSRTVFLGFAQDTAILIQVTMDITGGIARLIFSFIANIKGVDRVLLFGIMVSLDAIVIIGLPLAQTKILITLASALHGFISGAFITIQHAVKVDVAGVAQVAKLTGFFNMTAATAILIAVPLAGFIFDVTHSYDIPFFCIGTIHALGGGILLVLAIFNRYKLKTSSSDLPGQKQMESNQ